MGYRLVVAGMRHCVVAADDPVQESSMTPEEVERLFMKLS